MPHTPFTCRHFLKLLGALPVGFALSSGLHSERSTEASEENVKYFLTRDEAPDPQNIFFTVKYPGKDVFRYLATVQTFIINAAGVDELFEEKRVEGVIPWLWV